MSRRTQEEARRIAESLGPAEKLVQLSSNFRDHLWHKSAALTTLRVSRLPSPTRSFSNPLSARWPAKRNAAPVRKWNVRSAPLNWPAGRKLWKAESASRCPTREQSWLTGGATDNGRPW